MQHPNSAHTDSFVLDNLPSPTSLPEFLFNLPELRFPKVLNASSLLDRAVAAGYGGRPAVIWHSGSWTYNELLDRAGRIADYLGTTLQMRPGNRVMLIGGNSPMLLAAWWGVLRAGGVAVMMNPLLRSAELQPIIHKAQISHALVDAQTRDEFDKAQRSSPTLQYVAHFSGDQTFERSLDRARCMAPVPTASGDPALIAFTSGTTGEPKGCIHFHRDVLAMAETFSRHILQPTASDIFCGTPPFAFTFGLGAAIVFPAACGAATALTEGPGVDPLLDAIVRHRVTMLFTAPTAYRSMMNLDSPSFRTLRACVSAGEHLPEATSDGWFDNIGLRLVDGIGATEMMHIFISAAGRNVRPGSTGHVVPGFVAQIVDEQLREVPRGKIGRLAVRGPTGCRYLADKRQIDYVQAGWNLTGDLFTCDDEGYFWYVSRADDMIISSGYNIAAPEVENALLLHEDVAEAAVIGITDSDRGQICKAFIVLNDQASASSDKKTELQDHVKGAIAPYKYPREIVFVDALPKTHTGKLQRFALKNKHL